MPILKTKDLLSQLSQLEASLNDFSFEELNTKEAKALKTSFDSFRAQLENRIFSGQVEQGTSDKKDDVKPKTATDSKNIAENKLIAHVSHEIRTPLNGIIGFASLLKEENLKKEQLKMVNAIQTASYSLMEIINEVLEYSKLTSGTEDFEATDFNFHGLLKDVIFLCRTLVVDKNVELKVTIDPKIPKILVGDPSKLSQILLNLLGNAIKFVEKGHITLSVGIKEQKKNDFVLDFSVEDTGIGMSKEQLKTIFQSYKQANRDTFTKYGGSGLGLSIVKEIVEKQNGEIKVESSLGKGTTFQFTIPFKKGTRNNIPKKVLNTVNVQKGKELLRGTRILVFEDNELNQHLISEQLNKWGCKVFITADGEKGLGILKTQAIDIILMDLKMPGMTGFEISKIIRSDKDKKIGNTPIIALSADFTELDQEQCIKSGINDFLLKPYTLDELLLKVLKRKKEKALSDESVELLKQKPITPHEYQKIDLDAVLKDCFDDVSMLEELIRLFKQNVYEFIGAVKIHLSHEDMKEVALAAHKLKAGLAMIKAGHLKDIIIRIEEYSKKDDQLKVSQLFKEFLKVYPKYEQELDEEMLQLKKK